MSKPQTIHPDPGQMGYPPQGQPPMMGHYPDDRTDKELKGLAPKRRDIPYYVGLAGFWACLFGMIFAAMISPLICVPMAFLAMLAFYIMQVVYIVKAFKHEDSTTGKAGNIIGIVVLVFETLVLLGVGAGVVLAIMAWV